ncbi:MAG: RodZ domain-containing protein [Armatimonadota bacterium]
MQPSIAFLLLDGVPLRQTHTPSVALCALGLTLNGTFHPLEIRPVAEEDERAWLTLLRGLHAQKVPGDPLLICCDGHPAVMGAIRETFPRATLQLSVPHRLAAIRGKVDPSGQAAFLTEARRIFQAHDRDAAVARFLAWRHRWRDRGGRIVHDLEADLPLCLAFYRFPANLRRTLRSVSAVKRAVRRARPPALMEESGGFISVRELQAVAQARSAAFIPSAPPLTSEARAVAPPRAPVIAARIDAHDELRDVRKLPRPRRRLPYEFWAGVCLAALLAIMGAAEFPQLLRLSLGLSSSSRPAIEQHTAPGHEAVDSQHVPQAPNSPLPVPVPASTPLPSPPSAPAQSAGDVPLTRGVMVVISATGLSWIRVTADGVKVFENVLRPGDVRRWSANRVLQIRSGNAGGVDVTVNGRRLGVLGRVGQIASRAFTRVSPGP